MFKESIDLQLAQHILHRSAGTIRDVGTLSLFKFGGQITPTKIFDVPSPLVYVNKARCDTILLLLLQTNKAVLTRSRIGAEMHSNFMV